MHRYSKLGFLLTDSRRLHKRRFEQRAKSLGLTLEGCRALVRLQERGGIDQNSLADLTEISPAALGRILDAMEADGWVQRRADASDRRKWRVYITEKAKPMLARIYDLIDQSDAEAFQGFTEVDRAVLLELLQRVDANLSSISPLMSEREDPQGD